MAVTARINPTIFDKLIASTEMAGLHRNDAKIDDGISSVEAMRYYSVPKLERFNEQWSISSPSSRCRPRC
jgi:type VI secretion system protein ImpF